MSVTRKQKEESVKTIKDKLATSDFIAFLNFHGLTVAKASELRRALRKAEGGYIVSKKTLLGVAAKESGLDLDIKKLEGEIGVAVGGKSEDSNLSAAKEIATFARKNKDILKIIGGLWNKDWIGEEEIKKLAAIPSREILLTQLAFMLTQPVASFARVLQKVGEKLETK